MRAHHVVPPLRRLRLGHGPSVAGRPEGLDPASVPPFGSRDRRPWAIDCGLTSRRNSARSGEERRPKDSMTTSAPSIDREEGPAALGRRLAKHYRRIAQRTVEEARIRGFAFTTMPPEGLEALAAEAQRWGFVVTFEMRRGFAQAMVRAGSPSGPGRAR